jgi:hypothetical protein
VFVIDSIHFPVLAGPVPRLGHGVQGLSCSCCSCCCCRHHGSPAFHSRRLILAALCVSRVPFPLALVSAGGFFGPAILLTFFCPRYFSPPFSSADSISQGLVLFSSTRTCPRPCSCSTCLSTVVIFALWSPEHPLRLRPSPCDLRPSPPCTDPTSTPNSRPEGLQTTRLRSACNEPHNADRDAAPFPGPH